MAGASSADKPVSSLKTCINGINALSGIGILSIPYALSSGGWLSLILLLLIAASACFTGHLIRCCMDTNPLITTYSDIAGFAFGRKAKVTASVLLSLELYLVATGLLILEGDNLHKLFPDYSWNFHGYSLGGRHTFVIVSAAAICPTMVLSNFDVMSYMSFGGVLSSLIVIVSVFCVGTTKEVGFRGKGSLVNIKGLPTALSLYTFCYGAHALFPPIYSSMRRKNQFSKVLLLSFIICTITYISMAILGYLIYGHNVQSQVTLNLPKEMIVSKIAIYTIIVGPIAKYSLTIMPIASDFQRCLPEKYQDNNYISFVIKMLLLISTMIMALVFPSFDSVTSLSGAFLIVCVSYLLPCVCYLKIFAAYKNLGYELVGILGIMISAVIVGVVGTYSSILQTVKQTN